MDKRVNINFKVSCTTNYGDTVFIVGNYQELGGWKPEKSIPLKTGGHIYPKWESPLLIFNMGNKYSGNLEYKYIIKTSGGDIKWEDKLTNNRIIQFEHLNTHPFLSVTNTAFNNSQNTSITTQQPPTNDFEAHSASSIARNSLPGARFHGNIFLPSPQNTNNYEGRGFEKYINSLVQKIQEGNQTARNWKKKLELVENLLAQEEQKISLEDLALIGGYLNFVHSGQMPTSEDGGHFRPNHHAKLAEKITKHLERHSTHNNSFIIRNIKKNLPAFTSEFRSDVPLTRIRDIAHRNDIDQNMKTRIKTTLQNKLHRSAGPEDLITAKNIDHDIQNGNYNNGVKEQFSIFMGELREFFNAMGLEENMMKLREHIRSCNYPFEIEEAINRFLFNKSITPPNVAETIESLDKVREVIINKLLPLTETRCDLNGHEYGSVCELELEEFLFVLLSIHINELPEIGENMEKAIPYIRAASLILRHLQLSNYEGEEASIIVHQLTTFLQEVSLAHTRDAQYTQYTHLRLNATIHRTEQLIDHFGRLINITFQNRIFALGMVLGISYHSVEVFSESLIRSHLIFQLSKLLEILSAYIRRVLNLKPFSVINRGEAHGKLVHLLNLEGAFQKFEENKDSSLIAFVDQVTGDEEIPKEISGVIIGVEIPQLSHLAIRVRQSGAICCSYSSINEYNALLLKSSHLVKVETKIDIDRVVIREWSPQKGSLTRRVSKDFKLGVLFEEKGEVKEDPLVLPKIEVDITDYILDTGSITKENTGSKAFNSGGLEKIRLSNIGKFSTPITLGIPYSIFHGIKSSGCIDEVLEKLENVSVKSIGAVAGIDKWLLEELKGEPTDIYLNKIIEGLPKYFPKDRENVRLAIRSSSNLEDLSSSAGAGLFDSVLNIPLADSERVKESIREVWASLYSQRAVLNRLQGSVPHSYAEMGILIQEMVSSELSFILHSLHPATHSSNQIYIELALGLGETLASAAQSGVPYRAVYHRDSGQVQINQLASYCYQLLPHPLQTNSDRVDYSAVKYSSDPAHHLLPLCMKLGKICEIVEEYFGMPQDIEGAVVGEEIYILQARPQII